MSFPTLRVVRCESYDFPLFGYCVVLDQIENHLNEGNRRVYWVVCFWPVYLALVMGYS